MQHLHVGLCLLAGQANTAASHTLSVVEGADCLGKTALPSSGQPSGLYAVIAAGTLLQARCRRLGNTACAKSLLVKTL